MLGIISAMPEELALLKKHMVIENTQTLAGRDFFQGTLFNQDIVLVLSRIGKVASSLTTTLLISQFAIEKIVFVGVAGSASANVHVGDVVIADNLIQHDMDCSPIFPRFEIPLTGLSQFSTDTQLTKQLQNAAEKYWHDDYQSDVGSHVKAFGISNPQIHVGTIATGDQFIKDCSYPATIKQATQHFLASDLLAFEMEGAAVAQVCAEFAIPYAIIRTISDNADHNAHIDFPRFIEEIASHYSLGIMNQLLI